MAHRGTDKSGIHTWLVLMKAHRTLTRHAKRSIEALDMCLSDFAILEALLHKGPQPSASWAAASISPANR
jgi:MarR family 2-MHQ and catechol resistance regulon transcriptional repressor